MDKQTVPRSEASELASLLDSPEIAGLVCELEDLRWTGRPGYPIRSMVGMALAKSVYAIPTWTRTVRLVREHSALQAAIGCAGDVPSEWACYRFTRKLRDNGDMLTRCIDGVTAALHAQHPGMGRDVAIDASDMPAFANGQRFVSRGGRERGLERAGVDGRETQEIASRDPFGTALAEELEDTTGLGHAASLPHDG